MGTSDPFEQRQVSIRRVRRGRDEARADAEFWLSMTAEQRVELLWEMALEELGLPPERRGAPDDQPRLSRSVRLVRRA